MSAVSRDWIIRNLNASASFLTDPICLSLEMATRALYSEVLSPGEALFSRVQKLAYDVIGSGFFGLLASVTTPAGIALRSLAMFLQSQPYELLEGAAEKEWDGTSLKLMSWNIAGVPAGYHYSDAGVAHWRDRIDAIIASIVEKEADVVCLYEVFDEALVETLLADSRLRALYPYAVFNVGPRAIGTNSGMFVFSKYAPRSIDFDQFDESLLVGRTKNCNKGILSFDIVPLKGLSCRIFTTHLQHSEELGNLLDPAKIGENERVEIEARRKEMDLVIEKMKAVAKDRFPILTGDLNFPLKEFQRSELWKKTFTLGEVIDPRDTWGGEGIFALGRKPVSPGCTLDYTFKLRDDTRAEIETVIVDTGYDKDAFHLKATSDHKALVTTITFTRPEETSPHDHRIDGPSSRA